MIVTHVSNLTLIYQYNSIIYNSIIYINYTMTNVITDLKPPNHNRRYSKDYQTQPYTCQ